ncbi:hypothetical protein DFH28DRAFT_931351 [Melampsora americana]|nr:hypothetical protein DFH28DRAFT_931351 [Melampsora americana]
MPPKRKANSEVTGTKDKSNQSNQEESSKKSKSTFQKIVPEITKEEFLEIDQDIKFIMNNNGEDQVIVAKASEFSIKINVNGVEKEVQAQLGINMTISGSKPTKKSTALASNGKKGKTSKKTIEDDEDED